MRRSSQHRRDRRHYPVAPVPSRDRARVGALDEFVMVRTAFGHDRVTPTLTVRCRVKPSCESPAVLPPRKRPDLRRTARFGVGNDEPNSRAIGAKHPWRARCWLARAPICCSNSRLADVRSVVVQFERIDIEQRDGDRLLRPNRRITRVRARRQMRGGSARPVSASITVSSSRCRGVRAARLLQR